MKKACVAMILFSSVTMSLAQATDDLKAFPVAEAGMSRHVLRLPGKDNEANLKVELIIGKKVMTDQRNRYFFGGDIVEHTAKGWGYPYYKLDKLGPLSGTLMAVNPAQPHVERFVALGGEPYLIRYNSRLPVVVYAPEEAEVRYRIWHADQKTLKLERE